MEIKFNKKFSNNPKTLLRRCGYKPWYDPIKGREAYIRRLTLAFYPRFHIFWHYDQNNFLVIDLHLDSRRPFHRIGVRSFEDEESRVVRDEAERIRLILGK